MSIRHLLRQVAAITCAAAALFGATQPASAAVVVASFDPPVGTAMPNVGYRGSAQFFINDACLQLTGLISNANACSENTMAVTGATIEFYDLLDESSVLATLNFPGSSFTVFGATVFQGEVTGFDTSFADPALFLELDGFQGTVALGFTAPFFEDVLPGASLQLCPRVGDCSTSNVATTTYTVTTSVPEPGTLALLGLAALGAGAASRRRG